MDVARQLLAWLGQQAHAMGNVIGAVAANEPMPARSVLVYAVALLVTAWAVLKIARKISS